MRERTSASGQKTKLPYLGHIMRKLSPCLEDFIGGTIPAQRKGQPRERHSWIMPTYGPK